MHLTKNIKITLISVILINLIWFSFTNEYFEYFQKPIKSLVSLGEKVKENFFEIKKSLLSENGTKDYSYMDRIKEDEKIEMRLPIYCEKVIVVTTINKPTLNLKYMRDALYGWCLLVVFDKKTPNDWSYKNTFFIR